MTYIIETPYSILAFKISGPESVGHTPSYNGKCSYIQTFVSSALNSTVHVQGNANFKLLLFINNFL